MFHESLQTKNRGAEKIIAGFQKTYPDAHCELTYACPLQWVDGAAHVDLHGFAKDEYEKRVLDFLAKNLN